MGEWKHGHCTAGLSPTYLSWLAMRNRCNNPKNEKYPMYGGRGIAVCARWNESFEAFLEDMGERPPGMTIDREDGTRGYEPGNCRWATPKMQGENSNTHAKGWKRDRTHCPNGHAFTAENTRIVKAGYRRCRTCDAAHVKRRNAKRPRRPR